MRQLQCISQLQARITARIIILDKSTRNKILFEFVGDYKGVCLKKKFLTNRAKTRKCVFAQIFHSFEKFATLKNL